MYTVHYGVYMYRCREQDGQLLLLRNWTSFQSQDYRSYRHSNNRDDVDDDYDDDYDENVEVVDEMHVV